MNFNLKKILTQAEKQGWRIVQGTHIKLYPKNRSYAMVTVARSPSDHRAKANILSQLRKAGLKV